MPGFHDQPTEPLPPLRDPYAAFRSRDFRLYSLGNFASVLGRQMLGVAVGYEVFRLTHSATALGLIGLTAALPVILLALPAGQVADRFDRRIIIIATQAIGLLTSICLALLSAGVLHAPPMALIDQACGVLEGFAHFFGETEGVHFGPAVPPLFALLLVGSTARTFGWAARAPLLANLVAPPVLPNAITWNSSMFEIGCVAGPAAAGFLIAGFGFPTVYAIDAACSLIFISFLLPIRQRQVRHVSTEHPLRELFSGLRFVLKTKVILAVITLDLFAVLFGGATALLPIFADKILHVGPVGLGWLRSAQSLGAVMMALTIAHRPPMKRAGWTLLWAVAGYGAAMIVFGLSQWFWLSLLALFAAGAMDNISVVVRHTLVQLRTPDAMRGRVAAVNNIFIGSSNELGAFESGVVAARIGPVLSVVTGGIATLIVVALTAWRWPEVRKIGPLDTSKEV